MLTDSRNVVVEGNTNNIVFRLSMNLSDDD